MATGFLQSCYWLIRLRLDLYPCALLCFTSLSPALTLCSLLTIPQARLAPIRSLGTGWLHEIFRFDDRVINFYSVDPQSFSFWWAPILSSCSSLCFAWVQSLSISTHCSPSPTLLVWFWAGFSFCWSSASNSACFCYLATTSTLADNSSSLWLCCWHQFSVRKLEFCC